MLASIDAETFRAQYASVFAGDERWRTLPVPTGDRFDWDADSTYIRRPPFLEGLKMEPTPPGDIHGARVLALLGDSITTDHISPAGSIKADSPAGKYLQAHGVEPKDFNSYGARRGNHEVMMRGTSANVRLKNVLAGGTEGGWTTYQPGGELMSIYDAAMKYQEAGVPLLIIAGKEYGSGSSRDWAAKGTQLLGVKAVIAESFERIHRSNLVNMGVLPLQFKTGESAAMHGLTGLETYTLSGVADGFKPMADIAVTATATDGAVKRFTVTARVDTPEEVVSYRHGGILPYVVRQLTRDSKG
jgi:aconitate hydratase